MPVAIVTGCSQGIGRAIATRLAEDGYSVTLNDLDFKRPQLEALALELKDLSKKRTKADRAPWATGKTVIDYKNAKIIEADEEKEQEFIVITGDVSNEESVQALVDGTVSELGSLDVMVANAGMFRNGTVTNTTVKEFDQLYNVNVKGVFLCYKYAAQQMLKQGRGGRLLAASSLAGIVAEDQMFGYGASKFAVRGLNHSAARELGKHGITCNTYSPGPTMTELLLAATPKKPDGSYDFGMKEAMSPLRRLGTPEDLASIVSYLASPESKFITAQTISVDGGASSAA